MSRPDPTQPLPEGLTREDICLVYVMDRANSGPLDPSETRYNVWLEGPPDDTGFTVVEEFDWDTDDHEAALEYAWILAARFGIPDVEEY